VIEGDALSEIAQLYQADVMAIAKANDLENFDLLQMGQQLIIPEGTMPLGALVQQATDHLKWPMYGRITNYFVAGWHNGIDIANGYGAPVYAAEGGRVIVVQKLSTGFGWYVVLDHENGFTTFYTHLSDFEVDYGEWVTQGAIIGYVGSTGNSTGPHLHFEVRNNNVPRDPLSFLP
jgi:murein DD-endopeptidase MepM/ murein hydrolase activator NlpD